MANPPVSPSQPKGCAYWLLMLALIAGVCSVLAGLFSWTTPANHVQDLENAIGARHSTTDHSFDYEKEQSGGDRASNVFLGLLWCGGALYGLHRVRQKQASQQKRI